MDQAPITTADLADLAELHPMLFRTSTPKPGSSISEQHAFAVAVHATRPPNSPAVCCLLAAQMASAAGKASHT